MESEFLKLMTQELFKSSPGDSERQLGLRTTVNYDLASTSVWLIYNILSCSLHSNHNGLLSSSQTNIAVRPRDKDFLPEMTFKWFQSGLPLAAVFPLSRSLERQNMSTHIHILDHTMNTWNFTINYQNGPNSSSRACTGLFLGPSSQE